MASKDFRAIVFHIKGDKRALLLAMISDWPFNGFEEKEDHLIAYIAETNLGSTFYDDINSICTQFDCKWTEEFIPYQNWNTKWESSFDPIKIGDFVGIRADFHPPFLDVEHELLIHPRMAFGTGHHATTYLVMERMKDLGMNGKSVFDYGCGTGILAVLASMLKASPIDAVDIEDEATSNTLVNMEANNVSNIQIFTGDINVVPKRSYEIILANINRNVILNTLTALYERSTQGGDLLISGILKRDRELVEKEASRCGYNQVLVREREGWLMLHYQRP